MFIHDTHMPQLLTPEQYVSPGQYQFELETLFYPGWQFVGSTADLPRDGDYFTLDLYGYPLIVWNSGGQVQTFINVCPHRFSRLRSGCGHAGDDRLVCQYHGWEFDRSGVTRKIPDAASFKPMTKGALGLQGVRTETVGQLIFVNLSGDAPDLKESLGPGYDLAAELCSSDKRHFYNLDIEVEANWKLKVENSLESYHVEMVHTSTFGRLPRAEDCTHELHPAWTSFSSLDETEEGGVQLLDRLVHRLARVDMDVEYKHWLFYPNLMFAKVRLFTWAEMIMPVSPTKLRIRTAFFCYPGRSRGLRSRLLVKALASWGRKFFTAVSHEDANVLQHVQRGFAAPAHPSTGVISIREERVHHFQQWMQQATACEEQECERGCSTGRSRRALECKTPLPLGEGQLQSRSLVAEKRGEAG